MPPQTRHLTILLTDIKGFTDKTSSRSRADIQRLLDEHRDAVLPVLQERGGRLVKTIGDAFLMVFDSPTDAVLAGTAAQAALAKRNEGLSDAERIEIRVAINCGEVNLVEGDVFGEPVNITARIEGVAQAGEVFFTEAVYLTMNKAEVPSSEVGLLQLKGIPEKVRVYKVRRETPLGVNQAHVPAARPVPEFAPGEKARLAAPPSALPSAWRRGAAVLFDAAVCGLILSLFAFGETSEPARVHLRKKPKASAAAKAAGDAKAGPDMQIELGSSGLTVREPKKGRTVFEDADSGFSVEVEGDVEGRRKTGWWARWGFALVWLVYNMLCMQKLGATPGKKLMKLRVVSLDGAAPDKRQRWLRAAFSLVSGYAVGLGYLWALFEPQRRGWHDLIAGTRVVAAD